MKGQSSGFRLLENQFIRGTTAYLRSWLPTSVPFFPDMPCMKRFTKTNRRRYTGQQPGMKSGRCPADNRLSTAGQTVIVFPHWFTLGFACSCSPKDVQDSLEGSMDGCLLSETTRRRPVLPVPAPPRHPAVRRSAPTRPWYVRVLDSAGHAKHTREISSPRQDGFNDVAAIYFSIFHDYVKVICFVYFILHKFVFEI